MNEAEKTITTKGAALDPMDHAAFHLAFYEECAAASGDTPVNELFERAMARVRRFLASRLSRELKA